MSFKNDDDTYDEYLSLSDLAHEIRWAWLAVNAAIPLGRTPDGLGPGVLPADLPYSADDPRVADLLQFRALAFEHVLAQLGEFDFKVPPGDAEALRAGRIPPPTGNLEG